MVFRKYHGLRTNVRSLFHDYQSKIYICTYSNDKKAKLSHKYLSQMTPAYDYLIN